MFAVRPPSTFENFKQTRRFDALDGLRTVSILLVLVYHSGDAMWLPLQGYLGVLMFFVISGFIITTLLLREHDADGRVSIKAFYIRRAFRILPLYYLVFVTYLVLMQVTHDESLRGPFLRNIGYYLTYNNEFAGPSAFTHTWSLAVEEKFYLVWPLLAFGLVTWRRRRIALAAALFGGFLLLGLVPETSPVGWLTYFSRYSPIMGGCLVALVMHQRRGFDWVRRVATSPLGPVLVVASAVLWGMQDHNPFGVRSALNGLVLVAGFPVLILTRPAVALLATRPMVHLGTRSYAFYLLYPLTIRAGDIVLPPGGGVGLALVRFVVMVIIGAVAAEGLHWFYEKPLIGIGRRLAKRVQQQDLAAAGASAGAAAAAAAAAGAAVPVSAASRPGVPELPGDVVNSQA
jgi:peptidoglycan/LPS O-acetylase OafA/YrhL